MLQVRNLCKKYFGFELKNVSFDLPSGFVMGFIGANGAGKTTTMKCILNMVTPDSGSVTIFGEDYYANEIRLKQYIGFNLGPVDYYSKSTIKKVIGVYKLFFDEWNDNTYRDYLAKFEIDENKRICELSAGMKVKLGIAMSLSHNAKLIIFDEPTSGLDPVARDELSDLFREIVESGERSVLFSTHVTSDLDKCADYVIFIRDGELILSDTKDDLLDKYVLIAGKTSDFTEELQSIIIGCKMNAFGFTALMLRSDLPENAPFDTARPNLENIMVYFYKEIAHD